MGKTSDKPLLINMADGNNDLVNLDPSSQMNNQIFPKRSSKGLSRGAIVGIVLACCVALIAAAVAAFLCLKQNRAPIQDMNVLQSNSTNSIKNGIY